MMTVSRNQLRHSDHAYHTAVHIPIISDTLYLLYIRINESLTINKLRNLIMEHNFCIIFKVKSKHGLKVNHMKILACASRHKCSRPLCKTRLKGQMRQIMDAGLNAQER